MPGLTPGLLPAHTRAEVSRSCPCCPLPGAARALHRVPRLAALLDGRHVRAQMLHRNAGVKAAPQRWQDCSEPFDVAVTFEERILEQLLDGLPPACSPRPKLLKSSTRVCPAQRVALNDGQLTRAADMQKLQTCVIWRVRERTQSPAPLTVSPTALARCACRAAAGCSADPPVPLRALVVASAFHSTFLTDPHSHLGCSGRCAPRRRRRRCLHPAGCRGPPSGCPAWRPGGCGAAPGGARRRRRRCTRGWTRLRSRMALPGQAPHVSSVSLHV